MSRDGGAVNPSVSLTADSSFYTREPLQNRYILRKTDLWYYHRSVFVLHRSFTPPGELNNGLRQHIRCPQGFLMGIAR